MLLDLMCSGTGRVELRGWAGGYSEAEGLEVPKIVSEGGSWSRGSSSRSPFLDLAVFDWIFRNIASLDFADIYFVILWLGPLRFVAGGLVSWVLAMA